MGRFIIVAVAAAFYASGALAQSRADQNSKTQGSGNDPEEKVRMGAEAAAGGTGDPTARGDRARANGPQTKKAVRKGREHDERSSDREAGRGADGRVRDESAVR